MNLRCQTVLSMAAATWALLSGCTLLSPVYEGRYSVTEGWREAKVVEVGTTVREHPRLADCRKDGVDRPPDQLYAYLDFRPTRREPRVVPVAREQALRAGDLVYVNVKDCSAPVARRAGG